MAYRTPGEEEVGQLLERRPTFRDDLQRAAVQAQLILSLDEQAAGDPLEVQAGHAVIAQALGGVGRDGQDLKAGLLAQDAQRRVAVRGCDDRFEEFAAISRAVGPSSWRFTPTMPPNAATESHLKRLPVGLHELVVRGEADRIRVLDDRDRGRREVLCDPVRGVEIEQVVERGRLAVQVACIGQRAASMRGLAVERRALVRVLAVGQVADLFEDQCQARREDVPDAW